MTSGPTDSSASASPPSSSKARRTPARKGEAKMPSAETAAAVERELRIDATPEVVWPFLVDPDKMIQWMGRSAELAPRPGGTFRVDLNGKHIASGTYVELDEPRRAVFTWGWEG